VVFGFGCGSRRFAVIRWRKVGTRVKTDRSVYICRLSAGLLQNGLKSSECPGVGCIGSRKARTDRQGLNQMYNSSSE